MAKKKTKTNQLNMSLVTNIAGSFFATFIVIGILGYTGIRMEPDNIVIVFILFLIYIKLYTK